MSKNLNVGIAGLGTVGSGVAKILTESAALLEKKCGRKIILKAASSRSKHKFDGLNLDKSVKWYDSPLELASDSEIDIVIETIGGDSGVALDLCERSLNAGKHFITANKALLAKHGVRLAAIAESKNLALSFEAAVAGGIPVMKTLKEGLAANECSRIAGIMNGTCNYILTEMRETGRSFEDVLKEAQDLGYAEADPSFDVDGIDTAHKLSLLSAIAFGMPVDFKSIYVEGIREISLFDINYASELGYRIKLLGIAERHKNEIEQHVFPCFVPIEHPLAAIDGVNNAISISGNRTGEIMLSGRGAGQFPTASAVVADIVDIANNRFTYPFGVAVAKLETRKSIGIELHKGEYYLRITARDEAGILAGISDILKNENISVESIVQKPVKKGQDANIIVITHTCLESTVNKSVEKITRIKGVVDKPKVLRIES